VTDAELFPFMDTFRSVQRVFPLRGDEHEIRDVGASYFKAFRRFGLKDIQAGADRWIEQGKRFPKPAEWIDAIPRRVRVAEIVALSDEAGRDYERAERLRYEDAPCHCRECVEAGVNEKPLRFVPETNHDGTDRRVRIGDRVVVAGHWAHGSELARWYQGRADFYNRCLELGIGRDVLNPGLKQKKQRFEDRIKEIFERKPDERGER